MKFKNKDIEVNIIRNEKEKTINMNSDSLRKYQIHDNILGIGTITAIDENGNYIAVAHKIRLGTNIARIKDGTIYESSYVQEVKSNNSNVGNLVSNSTNEVLGTVECMTDYGLKGTYNKRENDLEYLEIEKATKGIAYIYCETPITNEIKMHEIEIIEVGDTKSEFIIKDKNLINQRGGGVVGMSGSTIIQDNKIVGGLSEIIIENPTKGKFVNIETMLNSNELSIDISN